MPSERTADKPTTRRHPQEEQAAAVRVARTLHAELGHDHGVVKRVAEQLSCYEAELIPLPTVGVPTTHHTLRHQRHRRTESMAESTSSERSDGKPNAADDEVFAAIRRARLGFADLVAGLNSDQLATPACVPAGRCATSSDISCWRRILRRRGCSPQSFVRRAATIGPWTGSRAEATRPFPDLVANLRANADSRFAVAGVGPRGPLTDVLVHTIDIAVP